MTFQRENFRRIQRELEPLVEAHHDEVGLNQHPLPFRPRWGAYGKADQAVRLYTFTARNQGQLVGYALYWVFVSPIFGVLQAENEAVYLGRTARRGLAALRFLRFCEGRLVEAAKVKIVRHTEWIEHPYGVVLKRLGYRPEQQIWWRFV